MSASVTIFYLWLVNHISFMHYTSCMFTSMHNLQQLITDKYDTSIIFFFALNQTFG